MMVSARTMLLSSLILIGALGACSKDKDDNQVSNEKWKIAIACHSGDSKPNKFSPTAVFEHDGAVLVEYYDPDSPELNIFMYQGRENHGRSIMVAGDDNIVFASLNSNDSVYILNGEEGLNTLFIGTVAPNGGEFRLTGEMSLDIDEIPTRSSYNDGDDIREIIKKSLFDKLAEEGSKIGDVLSIATLGRIPIGEMIKALSVFYSCLGTMVLEDGAGDGFKEDVANTYETQIKDVLTGLTQGLIIEMLPSPVYQVIANCAFVISGNILKGLHDFSGFEDVTERDAQSVTIPVFSRAVSLREAEKWVVPKERNPFSLSVSVDNIGEDHATFHGRSSYDSDEFGHAYDAPLEQGFMYTKAREGKQVFLASENMATKTVTLDPGSLYYVSAYVHTLSGKTWYSEPARFYTKGALLSFAPLTEFGFGSDGGEASTSVYVSDGATWRIVKKPSWCEVTSTSGSLIVNVPKHSKEREGYIVIETTSVYHETATSNLLVSQKEFSWDNTVWEMTGWYLFGEKRHNESKTIEFKSISKGYSEPDGSSGQIIYSVNSKGQAVVETKSNSSTTVPSWDEVLIFTRTGATSAKAVLDGETVQAGWNAPITVKIQGEYDCTLK